jgi:hypothetical protein
MDRAIGHPFESRDGCEDQSGYKECEKCEIKSVHVLSVDCHCCINAGELAAQ